MRGYGEDPCFSVWYGGATFTVGCTFNSRIYTHGIDVVTKEKRYGATSDGVETSMHLTKFIENIVDYRAGSTTDVATQSWVKSQGYLTSHQSLTDYAKKSDYVPKTGGTFTGTIYTNGIRVSPASGYDEYGNPSTLTNYIKAVIKKHVKADSIKGL